MNLGYPRGQLGLYGSMDSSVEITFVSVTVANLHQSERQSDGSRDDSEEPASYDDDRLEYGDGNDGELLACDSNKLRYKN